MKYTEPKMNMSVFDAENIITASGGTGESLSPAMAKASDAAKDKAGTNGVAINLLFE